MSRSGSDDGCLLWVIVLWLMVGNCSGDTTARRQIQENEKIRDGMRGDLEDLRQRVLALEAK